jgi:hypothetical protein
MLPKWNCREKTIQTIVQNKILHAKINTYDLTHVDRKGMMSSVKRQLNKLRSNRMQTSRNDHDGDFYQ